MLKIQKSFVASNNFPFENIFAATADSALASVIDAGAAILLEQPWRVARVIRGARAMTFDQLAEAARRPRATPPADFNRAIALAQVARALKSPAFRAAWARWREAAE
jgi:hypothetical protein